jgi:glycosyltransferase involved in cell wall biosynthesis
MAVWLSNFMQLDEPAEWRGLNDLLDWSLAGEIDKIGFIKRGMAEVFRRRHAPAETLLAYVRQIPTMPSLPRSGGPHLGIWAVEPIWRKLPYAMIAAASLIPNAQIWAVGQSTRASQLAELVNAPFRQISESPIPVEDMPAALAGMHLNLYVTLSECAPMLPLESLAAGTPCLVGPSAPYFDDFPRLYEQIVVTSPDDSAQLFQRIEAALERRADIIQTYSQFAHSYNREAKTQLNRFTGTDAD